MGFDVNKKNIFRLNENEKKKKNFIHNLCFFIPQQKFLHQLGSNDKFINH